MIIPSHRQRELCVSYRHAVAATLSPAHPENLIVVITSCCTVKNVN